MFENLSPNTKTHDFGCVAELQHTWRVKEVNNLIK